MKLCKSCTHYQSNWVSGDNCRRPLSDRISPVSGRLLDRLDADAERERASDRTLFGRVRCGPEARFYAE